MTRVAIGTVTGTAEDIVRGLRRRDETHSGINHVGASLKRVTEPPASRRVSWKVCSSRAALNIVKVDNGLRGGWGSWLRSPGRDGGGHGSPPLVIRTLLSAESRASVPTS